MSMADFFAARSIEEVVHFTTHAGILGILDTRGLIPNAELRNEERLEYILQLNNQQRKDPRYASYNSMSITMPNRRFFRFSRQQHAQADGSWWCVLAMSPVIMEHPGVLFCSGNNTWPATLRKPGLAGLAGMFADRVPGTYNSWVTRSKSCQPNMPTSEEAEFLYPGRIPLDYLLRVYFEHRDHVDEFVAYARTLDVSLPPDCAVVRPSVFP